MRCPRCQATNPEGAAFCGQCYLRFDTLPTAEVAEELPRRRGDGPPDAAPTVGAPTTPADPPDGPPRRGRRPRAAAGRFHAEGDALGWTCAVCDTANDLSTFTCRVCGARMDAEQPSTGEEVDWTAARRAEALVPGLGHLRVGASAVGAARLAITALWLLGAVLLATGGLAGLLTATPLVAGVGALMIAGPADLDALRRGRPPRLDGRRFAYLVMAVTVGVIAIGALQALR